MTNGFKLLQELRLKKSNLNHCFDFILVSEKIGSGKPGLPILNEFFRCAGDPQKDQVLIVGDEYHADIIGRIKAGIKTC